MQSLSISRAATLVLAVASVSAIPASYSQTSDREYNIEEVRESFAREYLDYRISSGQTHPPSTQTSDRDRSRIRSSLDFDPYADPLADEQSASTVAGARKFTLSEPVQQPISIDDVPASCFHIKGFSTAAPHINNRRLRLTADSTPSFRNPRNSNTPAATFHLSHDGALTTLPSGNVLAAPAHPSGGEWASFISRHQAEKDPGWYPLAVCKVDGLKQRLACSHPGARVAGGEGDLEPLTLSILRTDYCSFSGENGSVHEEDVDVADASRGNECSVAWWPMWGSPGWDEDADFRTIALVTERTDCPL